MVGSVQISIVRACIRASLFERAVRTMARPSSSRIRLPAVGSRKLSILLSATPPFLPPFLPPLAFFSATLAILVGRYAPLSLIVNYRCPHARRAGLRTLQWNWIISWLVT